MQHVKRLLWLFIAGFVTAAGVSFAIAIALLVFQDYSDKRREAKGTPDPKNYQPPPIGEVAVSGLTILEITRSGGVRGILTNGTKRKINSFNANLSFYRKEELLYSCNETVLLEVEPGKADRFQLICRDVDRAALSGDIVPRLSLVWVYPSIDK